MFLDFLVARTSALTESLFPSVFGCSSCCCCCSLDRFLFIDVKRLAVRASCSALDQFPLCFAPPLLRLDLVFAMVVGNNGCQKGYGRESTTKWKWKWFAVVVNIIIGGTKWKWMESVFFIISRWWWLWVLCFVGSGGQTPCQRLGFRR